MHIVSTYDRMLTGTSTKVLMQQIQAHESACTHVYVHTCMHTHAHTQTDRHTHARMHARTHARTYVEGMIFRDHGKRTENTELAV